MPERLGRALATAVPQTIQNIRGIEDIRASETERRAQDFAIKEAEAKSARDNQLVSVDAIREGMGHATKGQKDFVLSRARQRGIINEHEGVRRADIKDFLTGFSKEDQVASNTIGLGDVNTNLKSIEEQLTTGQIQEGDKTRNINEKEMQGLQQQKQQLLGQQQKYINVLSALGVTAEKTAVAGATKTIDAIHQAQTGKPFSEGTQETQQASLDEQQAREVEKSRQTGAVAEEFRLRKGLSGESAGKLALLTQASRDVKEVKGFLFDKKGELKLASQAAGFFNLPVAQGRQINSRIQNAVAAKLRAETGAAANADEVRNIAKRFEPVPGLDDGPATKDKLDRLEEFLTTGAFFIDPTGKLRERSLQDLEGDDLSNLSDDDILKELNK